MSVETTQDSTAIEKLAKNILETRFEDFDRPTLENAKDRIIDTIGCLIGGSTDTSNPELVQLIKDHGGKPEATILIYGGKVPVCHAAMVNCVLCRSFDYEPVSPLVDGRMVPGHISGTTVMTAISITETLGMGGRDLITAMLVGDDMTARVLATSGFNLNLGWDGNGTANAFGATAIAGRLLGLNETQLRHAFGLVLSQMGGSMQNIWDGTPAFKLPQGLSARNGIFSAQLAATGWTGPEDALLSPYGYYFLYTNGFRNDELLLKNLGKSYYGDRTFKPYPACRATHAAIDCALAIAEKQEVRPDTVREIHVFMSPGSLKNFCGKPWEIGQFPHGDAAFSYSYTVAVALLNKGVKPEHFKPEAIQDPRIQDIVQRIKMMEWPETGMSGTGLKVIMKDGTEIMETCRIAKGDPANPLSREELMAKFMENVLYSQTISNVHAEKLLSLLERLEELDNINEIIRLLVQ